MNSVKNTDWYKLSLCLVLIFLGVVIAYGLYEAGQSSDKEVKQLKDDCRELASLMTGDYGIVVNVSDRTCTVYMDDAARTEHVLDLKTLDLWLNNERAINKARTEQAQ